MLGETRTVGATTCRLKKVWVYCSTSKGPTNRGQEEIEEKAEVHSVFFASVFTGKICLLPYQNLKAGVKVCRRESLWQMMAREYLFKLHNCLSVE